VVGVNDFPFLGILTLLPLVGAVVVAMIPKRRAELAKTVALGWSLVVLPGSPSPRTASRWSC
jgi:NADH-quinone oxidoreductase subunit M